MADYKQMYLTLLDATEKAMNILISAQKAAEEIYIDTADEGEKKDNTISVDFSKI